MDSFLFLEKGSEKRSAMMNRRSILPFFSAFWLRSSVVPSPFRHANEIGRDTAACTHEVMLQSTSGMGLRCVLSIALLSIVSASSASRNELKELLRHWRDNRTWTKEWINQTIWRSELARVQWIKEAAKVIDDIAARKRGCLPSSRPHEEEAYVTMWYGSPRSQSWDGLKVLVHSIRMYDAERRIIIMVISKEQSEFEAIATSSQEALAMQSQYAPLSFLHTQPFKLTDVKASFSPVSLCAELQKVANEPMSITSAVETRSRVLRGHLDQNGNLRAHFLSKFRVWGLVQYSRVLYLDSDVMLGESLEQLWKSELLPREIAAAVSTAPNTQISLQDPNICSLSESFKAKGRSVRRASLMSFNCGVLLLRPSEAILRLIFQYLSTPHLYLGCVGLLRNGDQFIYNTDPGFMRVYTRCLPRAYNCYIPSALNATRRNALQLWRYSGCLLDKATHVAHDSELQMPNLVHFAMSTKPWNSHGLQGVLYDTWRDRLQEYDQRVSKNTTHRHHVSS